MLRVGVLIDQLRYAGVEKIAVNEVLALRQMGVEAKLIVMKRGPLDTHIFKDILERIPVLFLSDRLPRVLRLSFRFPVLSFFSLFHMSYPLICTPKINRKEFDAIISHGTYTSFTALAFWKFKKLPFISYIWDPASYIIETVYSERIKSPFVISLMKSIGLFVDKRIIQNSRLILTACNAHLYFLNTQVGENKVRMLYPAVDSASEVNQNKDSYLVAATAWKEGKEPEYLFKIAEKFDNTKIVVAGSWYSEEYQQNYIEQINSLGLQKKITVTGALSEEQMREVFKNALFFLQFKADIGFGMPALEAAANGCTFVIPAGQGVCNLFENGVDGFYIKEKDLDAILAYTKLLTEDNCLATAMGVAAWKKVKQRYSWAKHAHELSRLCYAVKLGEST